MKLKNNFAPYLCLISLLTGVGCNSGGSEPTSPIAPTSPPQTQPSNPSPDGGAPSGGGAVSGGDRLSSQQTRSLTPTQLQGLSAAQTSVVIHRLNYAGMHALTAAQITILIQNSLLNISALSDAQIQGLTPERIRSVSTIQMYELQNRIALLSPLQWIALLANPTFKLNLSAEELQALSLPQIQILFETQRTETDRASSRLSQIQIEYLLRRGLQVSALSNEHVRNLSLETIQALQSTQVIHDLLNRAGFPIQHLSDAQIQSVLQSLQNRSLLSLLDNTAITDRVAPLLSVEQREYVRLARMIPDLFVSQDLRQRHLLLAAELPSGTDETIWLAYWIPLLATYLPPSNDSLHAILNDATPLDDDSSSSFTARTNLGGMRVLQHVTSHIRLSRVILSQNLDKIQLPATYLALRECRDEEHHDCNPFSNQETLRILTSEAFRLSILNSLVGSLQPISTPLRLPPIPMGFNPLIEVKVLIEKPHFHIIPWGFTRIEEWQQFRNLRMAEPFEIFSPSMEANFTFIHRPGSTSATDRRIFIFNLDPGSLPVDREATIHQLLYHSTEVDEVADAIHADIVRLLGLDAIPVE